ncbi:uncharacterized protein TNCV_1296001 [Trichonephila clavipes]|uniref:Uncharacterized protein n=1 Tax=Trichonephila clavipes TaxID=2585209 RepID=A0A8X6VIF4_TRICX|nr:uncharacterized protein TNCV_1296001 [Trichonephila clavipes]
MLGVHPSNTHASEVIDSIRAVTPLLGATAARPVLTKRRSPGNHPLFWVTVCLPVCAMRDLLLKNMDPKVIIMYFSRTVPFDSNVRIRPGLSTPGHDGHPTLKLKTETSRRRAASPLVRLVEGEERWEATDHPQGPLPQNWGETELNRSITCMVLKATDNNRRHLAIYHDEFRGP